MAEVVFVTGNMNCVYVDGKSVRDKSGCAIMPSAFSQTTVEWLGGTIRRLAFHGNPPDTFPTDFSDFKKLYDESEETRKKNEIRELTTKLAAFGAEYDINALKKELVATTNELNEEVKKVIAGEAEIERLKKEVGLLTLKNAEERFKAAEAKREKDFLQARLDEVQTALKNLRLAPLDIQMTPADLNNLVDVDFKEEVKKMEDARLEQEEVAKQALSTACVEAGKKMAETTEKKSFRPPMIQSRVYEVVVDDKVVGTFRKSTYGTSSPLPRDVTPIRVSGMFMPVGSADSFYATAFGAACKKWYDQYIHTYRSHPAAEEFLEVVMTFKPTVREVDEIGVTIGHWAVSVFELYSDLSAALTVAWDCHPVFVKNDAVIATIPGYYTIDIASAFNVGESVGHNLSLGQHTRTNAWYAMGYQEKAEKMRALWLAGKGAEYTAAREELAEGLVFIENGKTWRLNEVSFHGDNSTGARFTR